MQNQRAGGSAEASEELAEELRRMGEMWDSIQQRNVSDFL